MKRIPRIIMTAAVLAISVLSYAQNEPTTQEFALPSMRIGHNPVAQGMGGAGVLTTSTIAWGSYGNIAAVPFSNLKGDIQFSYNNWNPTSSNYYNGALGFNIKNKIGISAGFSMGAGNPYDMYDDNGDPTGEFTPKNFQGNLGVSWRFVEWVSLGVNLRFAGEKLLEDYSSKAFATDIFLMGDYKGIRLAAGVSNLGGAVKDSEGNGYPLATSAVVALGYSNDFGDHRVEAEADMDYYFSGKKFSASAPLSLSMGAAYTYHDIVSVRGGYHMGGVIGNYGSVGLGVKFFGVRIDAAYMLAGKESPVNNTITAGIGYCF